MMQHIYFDPFSLQAVLPVWHPRWTVLLLLGTLRSLSECLCSAPLKMAFTCFLWAASSCSRSSQSASDSHSGRENVTLEERPYVCLGVGWQAGPALHHRGFLSRLQGEGARQPPGQLLQRIFIHCSGTEIYFLAGLQVLYKTTPLRSWL